MPYAREESTRGSARERRARRAKDPAVEGVRAQEELDEARDLTTRLRQLREKRTRAQRRLAELKEENAAVKRARRDLRAVAGEIYRDPDGAIRNWQKLVAEEKGAIVSRGMSARRVTPWSTMPRWLYPARLPVEPRDAPEPAARTALAVTRRGGWRPRLHGLRRRGHGRGPGQRGPAGGTVSRLPPSRV